MRNFGIYSKKISFFNQEKLAEFVLTSAKYKDIRKFYLKNKADFLIIKNIKLSYFFNLWHEYMFGRGEIMDLIVNPRLTKKEITTLYDSVGWKKDVENIDNLKKGLKKSFVIAAYEDGCLVGLVRALSDFSTVVYIQDLLVCPEFQGKRIGKTLMLHLLNYFGAVGQIMVAAKPNNDACKFFHYLGFQEGSDRQLSAYVMDRRVH
ncbi:GNAT family N-acetyltransferase [Ligilactobacillus acidipiscis]|uniref:Acetyltransferase, GNAT family n=1 Tax=Ligilactobacillus acidipiscis TaxID=89059 RepID=A0A1K1KQT1_9LACO|nr:GNAT family N-acetyltransferase [Ligilactobacillus acidipiscis]SFV41245.1 acetyltransferase, GNAT family [Ligilactobacillus acidipiscis]